MTAESATVGAPAVSLVRSRPCWVKNPSQSAKNDTTAATCGAAEAQRRDGGWRGRARALAVERGRQPRRPPPSRWLAQHPAPGSWDQVAEARELWVLGPPPCPTN